MLNLAGFGPDEHQLFIQAGIEGLGDLLGVELPVLHARLMRAAGELGVAAPTDLVVDTWWHQARTLQEA
jgi:hypothetical protein